LADGTGDAAYLDALDRGLRRALGQAGAELAIYLAGADPFAGDRLGRLAVSKPGLAERDRLVFGTAGRPGCRWPSRWPGATPGTSRTTVEIHLRTVREALPPARTAPASDPGGPGTTSRPSRDRAISSRPPVPDLRASSRESRGRVGAGRSE
jgi:hypothetical protein